MTEVNFKFQGREEVFKIINTGRELVSYLSTQNSECPLIGAEIEFVKELGRGNYGSAFLIKIEGMGHKEYVAKKIISRAEKAKLENFKIDKPSTLKEISELQLFDSYSIPSFIYINGGDPNRLVELDEEIYFPSFAPLCLTPKSVTVKKFSEDGETTMPKGSYLCPEEIFSEYVIGMMCGDLHRSGISVNFFDVFGFATCPDIGEGRPEIEQYVFMEKIDGTSRKIRECLFDKINEQNKEDSILHTITNVLFIQIIHAVAVFQEKYQIVHGDLHDDNIFVEFIKPESLYKNQKIYEADWFHYQIDNTDLYLPWIPLLVKIGDFGFSVKYSDPIVGNREVIENGYGELVPNWFSSCYDVLFISQIFHMYSSSDFVKQVFMKVMKTDNENVLKSKVETLFDDMMRPSMKFVSECDKYISPRKILTDKKLMKDFAIRPPNGKIMTLGKI